jgi:threonine/homoserine/homoserine lactone efflux protein
VGAAAADAQAGAQVMFLGFYFIALAVPVCAGLVIAAERVVASLRQPRKVMRAFDWLFAGLMAAFALKPSCHAPSEGASGGRQQPALRPAIPQ